MGPAALVSLTPGPWFSSGELISHQNQVRISVKLPGTRICVDEGNISDSGDELQESLDFEQDVHFVFA